ncbi:MAG: hypothetical protein JO236_13840 [Mycobacterium sp.]|uniref:hypothetical protein n=1 Tax=Mycobacterium sp. TaxID=1785 RepID=UPI001EC963D5|nr:hypothetical protein [Mycobacterium sp.]MBW0018609.1 hypothetical protein [Mycobacterium sp.]
MQELGARPPGDHLGQDDNEVRAAIRFAVVAALAGVGFLILAAVWVSTCGGTSVDTVACGPPERTLLGFGGPVILLIAGLWAFYRTYRVWRDAGTWWGWHGAGWFLLTLMAVTLSLGVAPIAGLVLSL